MWPVGLRMFFLGQSFGCIWPFLVAKLVLSFSHEDLLALDGIYAEMWKIQNGQ